MTQDVKKYQVTILGESYTLLSDESDILIQETIKYLDDQLKDVAAKSKASNERIAILVALKLAQKVLSLENEHKQTRLKEHQLIDLVSSVL